jgi:hypothetical protein
MFARLAAVILVLVAAMFTPRLLSAQNDYTRFEILEPSDTAFTIVLGEVRWMKPGMTGIVVDPRQRDVRTATFTVSRVDGRRAVARVTGLTSGLTTFHMALVRQPRRSWLKQPFFWVGTALGLAVGFLAGRA